MDSSKMRSKNIAYRFDQSGQHNMRNKSRPSEVLSSIVLLTKHDIKAIGN